MNGAMRWVMAVLTLYGLVIGFLFTQLSAKADANAVWSLTQDVREIRSDVKDLLRTVGRGRDDR